MTMSKPDREGYQTGIPEEVFRDALESIEKRSAAPAETAPQVPANQSEQLQDEIKKLQEELEVARREAKETHDKMLRVAAEADNARKRMLREREDSLKYGQEKVFRDLLPVLDNLRRSLDSISSDNAVLGTIRQGVEMVYKQAHSVLASYQVLPFNAVGTPFDPTLHEAINQEVCDSSPPGTVIGETQKGYLIHDRLLRPAMVVVARANPAPEACEATPADPAAEE